ncbi:MAG: carbamoyltransferase [Phycisphaerae bacterium]
MVLGISCYYHDAGAALVRDGQLIAAAEEERFNRKKHHNGFPQQAIQYCLAEAGIDIHQVDHITFYEKPLVKFDRILETILAYWPRTLRPWLKAMPLWLGQRLAMANDIQKQLGVDVDILFNEHHLSHAASAFLVSPFEEAAILTADGVGEWASTAWGVGSGTEIDIRQELRFPHSVGLLFSAVTAYLGFRVNDAEWKVMGLAPYGKPTYVDKFAEIVDVKEDGSIRLNLDYFAHPYSTTRTHSDKWEELFGQPQRKTESELTDFHRDLAHSGQKVVEDIMVKMARHVQAETGMKKLCMAGGVALNCVANWRILQETDFDEVFIQPAAGDSGGALGAAFYTYNTVLKQPRTFSMKHGYWGPTFDDKAIRESLEHFNARFETCSNEKELLQKTAAMIADGKVVGWYQGRMEFGPRALGARSLLADARDEKMKDVINAKVKFREAFRPFAPAILRERLHEYFDVPEKEMDLPYMLMVPSVLKERRSEIQAVTHKDGTGRVQTVTEADNGIYYRLIKAYEEITGVPVVINTSFNVRGEPIVCTPADAYDTFVRTGIDALVIGSYIVTEKPAEVDYDAGMRRSVELEQNTRMAESVSLR